MERNHDHIARCCRPSHARGDARNGQATFALVSYTKRSDDPGRNPGASLSTSVVGWRGLSTRLALDYQRCCARHKSGRRAQRAAFLASACLGRAVCDCRRTLTPPSWRSAVHKLSSNGDEPLVKLRKPLVIILDQFEEYFAYRSGDH